MRLIIEEEKRRNAPMPLDALLVLAQLRQEKRLDASQIAPIIQKDEAAARAVLERLVEAGLAEAHGIKRGRTYTLSAKVYRQLGGKAAYIRQAGFDAIQQEQMVSRYVKTHGQITRRETVELCNLSPDQAYRLLNRLTEQGVLVRRGGRKRAVYESGPKLSDR
jgi:ATP-dependent DNA helicase RecG